ncbi:MAG: aminotransferase class III-fold pyridoxal phosphate-dependent enzyme [bacterium]
MPHRKGVRRACSLLYRTLDTATRPSIPSGRGETPPRQGQLPARATRTGAVLIFDEVMTGFRVAAGGAQAHYGITPDLTCLGKVIGGGLPVAAYGGRRDIMAAVAPSGKMYQAGTLSGNPIAMAAGIATLQQLQAPEFYATLTASAERVVEIVRTAAAKHGVAVTASNVGSMWGFFLCEGPVADYESAKRADTQKYATLFHTLLMHGVYVAPSQFEAAFISSLHGERELSVTAAAFDAAFAAIS